MFDPTLVLTLPQLHVDQPRFMATGLVDYLSDASAGRAGSLRVIVQGGERRITYIPRQKMRWSDRLILLFWSNGYGLATVISALKNTVMPDAYDHLVRKQFVHLVTKYNSRWWHFGRSISLETIFRRTIFHLPSQEELESLSLARIHKIWRKNLQTLIGILATEKIPRLGFHGTSRSSLEGIRATHISKPSYLWVAGINIALDPITHLADFLRAAQKALSYSHDDGGVFVLRTQLNQHIGKYVHDMSKDWETINGLDSVSDKKFLHLVHRNCVGENETFDASGQTVSVGNVLLRGHNEQDCFDHLYHPMDVFTVDEYFVRFTPENYSEVVRGVSLHSHSLYLPQAARTKRECVLQNLVNRFRQQELLVKVFASSLDWSEKKVREYTEKGKALLKRIDHLPQVSVWQLAELQPCSRGNTLLVK